jgi:hypothetical protein
MLHGTESAIADLHCATEAVSCLLQLLVCEVVRLQAMDAARLHDSATSGTRRPAGCSGLEEPRGRGHLVVWAFSRAAAATDSRTRHSTTPAASARKPASQAAARNSSRSRQVSSRQGARKAGIGTGAWIGELEKLKQPSGFCAWRLNRWPGGVPGGPGLGCARAHPNPCGSAPVAGRRGWGRGVDAAGQ